MPPFSFTWIEHGKLGACSAPGFERDLEELRQKRIALVVNLHDTAHSDRQLSRYGMRQLHLPVTDFRPPTQEQISTALAAIRERTRPGNPRRCTVRSDSAAPVRSLRAGSSPRV